MNSLWNSDVETFVFDVADHKIRQVVSCILNKNIFLTHTVSRGCQREAPSEIWWTSDEQIWSVCKFQNGCRRPSCFSFSRFPDFPFMGLLRFRNWCYMSNLVQIGLTVQKFSKFIFTIRNSITSTQKFVFLCVLGMKTYALFIILTSKRAYIKQKHVFWRILRENRFGGLGCTLLLEPPSSKKVKVNGTSTDNKFCIVLSDFHDRL